MIQSEQLQPFVQNPASIANTKDELKLTKEHGVSQYEELVSSELTFLNDIGAFLNAQDIIIKAYEELAESNPSELEPKDKVYNAEDMKERFEMLRQLRTSQYELFQALQTSDLNAWVEKLKALSDIYRKYIALFYVDWGKDCPKKVIDEFVKAQKTSDNLVKFSSVNLVVSDILIKPIQRLAKYDPLLKELAKELARANPSSETVSEMNQVLERVKAVIGTVNNSVKDEENKIRATRQNASEQEIKERERASLEEALFNYLKKPQVKHLEELIGNFAYSQLSTTEVTTLLQEQDLKKLSDKEAKIFRQIMSESKSQSQQTSKRHEIAKIFHEKMVKDKLINLVENQLVRLRKKSKNEDATLELQFLESLWRQLLQLKDAPAEKLFGYALNEAYVQWWRKNTKVEASDKNENTYDLYKHYVTDSIQKEIAEVNRFYLENDLPALDAISSFTTRFNAANTAPSPSQETQMAISATRPKEVGTWKKRLEAKKDENLNPQLPSKEKKRFDK